MSVSRVYKWKAGPSLEVQMWCENVVSDGEMHRSVQTCTPSCAIYFKIDTGIFFLAG